MPVPARLIAYHYVLEGELQLQLAGEAPLSIRQGQLLIFPRNPLHLLGSSTTLPPVDADALIQRHLDDPVARIRHGGGGARTRILCGFLGIDATSDALLGWLPSLICLDLAGKATGAWIEASLRHGMVELARGDALARANLARMAGIRVLAVGVSPGSGAGIKG